MLLWRRFLDNKVLLSCGKAFECSEPGWFRIIFADKTHRLQLGEQWFLLFVLSPQLQQCCFLLSLILNSCEELGRSWQCAFPPQSKVCPGGGFVLLSSAET